MKISKLTLEEKKLEKEKGKILKKSFEKIRKTIEEDKDGVFARLSKK